MRTLALIFDMDGTLLDNNRYHLKAWRTFFARHGVALTDEEYLTRVSGVHSAETIRRLMGHDLPESDVKSLQAEKESLYRDYIAEYLKPVAGLRGFLEEMRTGQVPMGVATSAPKENIAFTLEGLGVAGFFDVVTGADMVRRGKPDPEIFLLTARRLGFSPGDCIVFEDSVSGLQAARAASMHIVAVRTAHRDHELTEADLWIDDYRGLRLSTLRKLLDAK